eukprot:GILJ01000673.1.p1 GENE.GILJ01000673.1~~GILJ01000673.1.p1  ORF type:complete len:310 (-),score=68.12 GILJ01000673.1:128-1057(-)
MALGLLFCVASLLCASNIHGCHGVSASQLSTRLIDLPSTTVFIEMSNEAYARDMGLENVLPILAGCETTKSSEHSDTETLHEMSCPMVLLEEAVTQPSASGSRADNLLSLQQSKDSITKMNARYVNMLEDDQQERTLEQERLRHFENDLKRLQSMQDGEVVAEESNRVDANGNSRLNVKVVAPKSVHDQDVKDIGAAALKLIGAPSRHSAANSCVCRFNGKSAECSCKDGGTSRASLASLQVQIDDDKKKIAEVQAARAKRKQDLQTLKAEIMAARTQVAHLREITKCKSCEEEAAKRDRDRDEQDLEH